MNNFCFCCGNPSQGNYAIHQHGFCDGPEVPLCDDCGKHEEPNALTIWESIKNRTKENQQLQKNEEKFDKLEELSAELNMNDFDLSREKTLKFTVLANPHTILDLLSNRKQMLQALQDTGKKLFEAREILEQIFDSHKCKCFTCLEHVDLINEVQNFLANE